MSDHVAYLCGGRGGRCGVWAAIMIHILIFKRKPVKHRGLCLYILRID